MKLPRFTLRELFLLVVIAAMGCGWWVERNRLITENDGLRETYLRMWPTSPGQRLEVVIDEDGGETATLTNYDTGSSSIDRLGTIP